MPRSKQRTPALRQELLRSALATLDEHGPGGLTTRRVAQGASTSAPAVHELFGDKGGLVRELFYEGFRRLRATFDELDTTDDPEADLRDAIWAIRRFAQNYRSLTEIMFQRPFADFEPGPDDLAAGTATRRFLVDRVQRCIDAQNIQGDATDIAHGLLALAQGLATQETGGWLGTSPQSIDRRWKSNVAALIDGHRP